MVSDDVLQEAVDAIIATGGNKDAAARQLGIPRNTLRSRLAAAERRNLLGSFAGGKAPEGYVYGNTTQEWVTTMPDGRKVREWPRLYPVSGNVDFQEAIEEWANRKLQPIDPVMPMPSFGYAEGATVYPIPDVHLGQYSWGKETGDSYDLDIAANTVRQTFIRLVSTGPATREAVVLGLGDYFHADGNDARTPKSGNSLDVDSRFGKVQWVGAELLIEVVDMALQKHEHVTVKVLPGNHDPRAQDFLTVALWFRYKNNPRVTVDRKPGVHWFFQWGKTMIAAHHGHETKPEQMPGVMAAYEPAMWGETLYRYAYLGHFHRKVRGMDQNEAKGAIWEVFQAITAKDAWNRGVGHSSGRSITAIVLDKEKGEVQRYLEPIAP